MKLAETHSVVDLNVIIDVLLKLKRRSCSHFHERSGADSKAQKLLGRGQICRVLLSSKQKFRCVYV